MNLKIYTEKTLEELREEKQKILNELHKLKKIKREIDEKIRTELKKND